MFIYLIECMHTYLLTYLLIPWSRVYSGFGTMMIFACFKGAGQYCSLRIALKMYRRVSYHSWGLSCSRWAVISSDPGAQY
jgi:hypothetical protein